MVLSGFLKSGSKTVIPPKLTPIMKPPFLQRSVSYHQPFFQKFKKCDFSFFEFLNLEVIDLTQLTPENLTTHAGLLDGKIPSKKLRRNTFKKWGCQKSKFELLKKNYEDGNFKPAKKNLANYIVYEI